MNFRGLIFDLGNVLLRPCDTSPLKKWARQLNITEEDLLTLLLESQDSKLAFEGKITEEEFWRRIGKTLNLSPKQLVKFQQDYYKGEDLDPDLIKLIADLRPTCRVAILSNAWSNARAVFNSLYKLDSQVDDIIYSAEVGVAKPDESIYRIAADQLKLELTQIIFIDNKEENVIAASRLGMCGLLFKNSSQIITQIRDLTNKSEKAYGRATVA